MLDDMKKSWWAMGILKALQEGVFYAEGIDKVKLEDRLKNQEEYEPFSQGAPPEETKDLP